jgi:hypothetical protein
MNLYEYVASGPNRSADPQGLEKQEISFSLKSWGITLGHWKGAFVWSCVRDKEESHVDENPGFTGWSGSQVGFGTEIDAGVKVSLGIGLYQFAVVSNNSVWEDCSPDGRCNSRRYVVDLTVTIKSSLSVGIGLSKVMGTKNFTTKCPCRYEGEKIIIRSGADG